MISIIRSASRSSSGSKSVTSEARDFSTGSPNWRTCAERRVAALALLLGQLGSIEAGDSASSPGSSSRTASLTLRRV